MGKVSAVISESGAFSRIGLQVPEVLDRPRKLVLIVHVHFFPCMLISRVYASSYKLARRDCVENVRSELFKLSLEFHYRKRFVK